MRRRAGRGGGACGAHARSGGAAAGPPPLPRGVHTAWVQIAAAALGRASVCLEEGGRRAAKEARTVALWLTPAAARVALRGALTPLLAPRDGDGGDTTAADAFWSACERGRVAEAPSRGAAASRLWDSLIGARLLTTPAPASADVTTLALLLLADPSAKLAAGCVLLGCYREAAAVCASAAAAAAAAPPPLPRRRPGGCHPRR